MTVIENSHKQTNGQSVLKSYVDFDCTREWTAFVVPFRKREEHLPHFLEAISEHQVEWITFYSNKGLETPEVAILYSLSAARNWSNKILFLTKSLKFGYPLRKSLVLLRDY